MIHATDHIRLLAAVEFREPPVGRRVRIERHAADVLSGDIAEDLAACVSTVTQGQLLTGPALLEPGQLLSHGATNPWAVLAGLARPGGESAPGVTAFGAIDGKISHAALTPRREPRMALLCLPLVLRMPPTMQDETLSLLEERLFDHAGLRPPALARLASIAGVEPVHGQLMTATDLMALVKMQLAGAALEAFWPPVEHALLEPDQPTELTLPAGLGAHWSTERQAWLLALPALDATALDDPDTALWLRSFRHATAVMDEHEVNWAVLPADERQQIEPEQRWVSQDLGPANSTSAAKARAVMLDPVGLVGYCVVGKGRELLLMPLRASAIDALHAWLAEQGIEIEGRAAASGS